MSARRHLRPALRMVRAYARHPKAEAADRVALATAWNDVVGLPLLLTDGDGLRFVVYPGRNEHVYVEAGGNYERGEVALCRRLVGAGMTVFDVGANIGMYSLLFAWLAGTEGQVHAFEPEPDNAERLRLHLRLNPDVGPVSLSQAAVAASEKPVILHAFPERYNAWHSLAPQELPDPFNPGHMVRASRAIEVPCVMLDRYCEREGVDRIDLLKVDVEGGEPGVLEGARQLLVGHRIQRILFEVSLPQSEAFGADPNAIFQTLDRLGYAVRSVEPDGSLGGEVRRAGEHYANYLAEPRTAASARESW